MGIDAFARVLRVDYSVPPAFVGRRVAIRPTTVRLACEATLTGWRPAIRSGRPLRSHLRRAIQGAGIEYTGIRSRLPPARSQGAAQRVGIGKLAAGHGDEGWDTITTSLRS